MPAGAANIGMILMADTAAGKDLGFGSWSNNVPFSWTTLMMRSLIWSCNQSVIVCFSVIHCVGLILYNLLAAAQLKFENLNNPKMVDAKSFQLM